MNANELLDTLKSYPAHTAIRFSFDGRSESYLIETFHELADEHRRLTEQLRLATRQLETIRNMEVYLNKIGGGGFYDTKLSDAVNYARKGLEAIEKIK